ncbi:hypothetical protein HALLA_18070 [Halostagnicola larsenii XH-48]|uniref:Uncharacterized protein n=1 Tax=Halostagnicola larsenii XH-48 TaxID=797299 RepID=W0JVQ5_9EURY|nr:hypothetical protein HALLA_18070 [Halostagnicola larsenii XH-48]
MGTLVVEQNGDDGFSFEDEPVLWGDEGQRPV